tara:strand:- start:953 stop:1198 length:246 start_codon:yes stop_codon:yes gene_type:complete
MKFLLPNELWTLIYSYDNTYYEIYNRCIRDLNFFFMSFYFYSNDYLFQNDMYYLVDFENLNLVKYILRQIKIRKLTTIKDL